MWKTTNRIFILLIGAAVLSCSKKEAVANTAESAQTDSVQTVTVPASEEKTQYSTYEGAWFKIEYPSDFIAKNSLKSSTSSEGFDSAVFTSPDGKVEFYVFSPQWNGTADDIAIDNQNESIIDYSEEKKGNTTVKRWLIEANNGSYHRAYEEKVDELSGTNRIFGIQYSPDQYKDEYLEDYLHFKKSLIQYAD